MTEGDSSLPLCSSVSENFQVLVTVETQCSSGTVKINGMLFPDEALDLATSRGTERLVDGSSGLERTFFFCCCCCRGGVYV